MGCSCDHRSGPSVNSVPVVEPASSASLPGRLGACIFVLPPYAPPSAPLYAKRVTLMPVPDSVLASLFGPIPFREAVSGATVARSSNSLKPCASRLLRKYQDAGADGGEGARLVLPCAPQRGTLGG